MNGSYSTEASQGGLPALTAAFRDAGWDVFRLSRPRASEEVRAAARELGARVEGLKGEGYGKVVLAGQSAGAWLSLVVAGQRTDVHAVIANAPAYYGTDRPAYLKNGYVLYDNIDPIRRARIMLSFFEDDPYDPGGRGEKARAIFAAHGVPHLVIDRPAEFKGHGSGNSGLFLRRFGDCMLGIAGDAAVPTREECQSHWGETPSAELARAGQFAVLERGAPSPLDPFLGKWYGHYLNGREVLFGIERAEATAVAAVYVVGPTPDGSSKLGLSRRSGRREGGALVFEEPGRPRLRFALAGEGRLAAQWFATDGGSQLEAALKPLP
jgi:dienelactone hydrolase